MLCLLSHLKIIKADGLFHRQVRLVAIQFAWNELLNKLVLPGTQCMPSDTGEKIEMKENEGTSASASFIGSVGSSVSLKLYYKIVKEE